MSWIISRKTQNRQAGMELNSSGKINIMHLRSGVRGSNVILGAEAVILHIISSIDRSRFQTVVASFKDPYVDSIPLLTEAKNIGIPVELVHQYGRFDIVTSVLRLKRLIKKYNIHILHCHEYKSDIIGYLSVLNSGVHLISTQHLWAGEALRARFYEFMDSLIIHSRVFEKIVAVSEEIKSTLLNNGIKEERISVISNGIDVDSYSNSFPPEDIRFLAGTNADTRVVCCVGRLSPQKGHRYLIEAAPKIIKEMPNVVFLFVGDGPLCAELKSLAGRMGLQEKIIFLGFRKDIASILKVSDLFVLPSLNEGTPMALLEAMASGKAIVSAEVGGVPELITNGENGILVKPMDSEGLEKAILYLLKNPSIATEFGAKAKEFAKKNLSSKAMTRKYENLYDNIVRN